MSEQLNIEGYVDCQLIVEGALEDERSFGFGEGAQLDEWLRDQKGEAMRHPEQHTQIYLMQHDHSPDVEDCSCGQYVQDHHPFWEFGGK